MNARVTCLRCELVVYAAKHVSERVLTETAGSESACQLGMACWHFRMILLSASDREHTQQNVEFISKLQRNRSEQLGYAPCAVFRARCYGQPHAGTQETAARRRYNT